VDHLREKPILGEKPILCNIAIAAATTQNWDGMAQDGDPTAAGDCWYGGGFIGPAQGFGSG
jgi:hypothetical protein